jgi:4,5-DOPA dioxygenase extradiol
MPAIFFGHGNPMNTLPGSSYANDWAEMGPAIARPRAIICVSAHWYITETSVTSMPSPRTIHDFEGFPPELYRIHYPAPGDPGLAREVRSLLSSQPVSLDDEWGLDHGTWSVLRHVFPKADVPIIQLSIDRTKPAAYHFNIGRQLAPLRDDGVLIVGSGNLVHNLYLYTWERHHLIEPFDWAVRFERIMRKALISGDYDTLINYGDIGKDALLSVPTPDHYLPLLYIAGLRRKGEPVCFPVAGFDGGSMSMLAIQIG